jgi:anti-sigma B factor antagonist
MIFTELDLGDSRKGTLQVSGIVEIDPERRMIILHGEIDMANAAELRSAIAEADWMDGGPVDVDMADLRFIDSSGVGALLLATERGSRLILRAPTPPVRRVFEVLNLDTAAGIEIT